MMLSIHPLLLLLLFIVPTSAGPMEDLATMPDLSLFYQQLMRQQDIQMILQGAYAQPAGGLSEFTLFAPTNEAMERFNRKNEDPNLLWKYHLVPGRYDEQMIFNMAQEKLAQANPRQMSGVRPQNNLPTVAVPFQLFYGVGFYGGNGPEVNETYDNAGYGSGGISWLQHTAFNQTNLIENFQQLNPYLNNRIHSNPNHRINRRNVPMNTNFNPFPPNQNFSLFNPNSQLQQTAKQFPTMNFNPTFPAQQSFAPFGTNGGVGILRPTINNAFILQSRPMSRGIINVIDAILWPPERRDQSQYKTAFDALEDAQFSRIRQLAERSEYFRSELRSMHHQTWFLPNDQAFASMGSSLSYLLDQSSMNNTNDLNEFIRAHVVPLVLYPSAMDSTKQVVTSAGNKWVTFRKVTQPDQSFQIDVVAGRQIGRILVSRPEEIRSYGNGVVYPISSILSLPARSAADELTRTYQYFMNLVQQSGDLELLNLLQGSSTMNMFNPQSPFNITVLIPQQISIQQLGNAQDLNMNLRRHILRVPVLVDQLPSAPSMSNPYFQQNGFPMNPAGAQFPPPTQPNIVQAPYPMPGFQRNTAGVNQGQQAAPRRRRQITSQTQIFPNQQQPAFGPPIQSQPTLNVYPTPTFQQQIVFQDGQVYPTMDPQFTVQAQTAAGPNGNVVTLIGRPVNGPPFTATIVNSESNIPIRNGVMHVIRGLLSGAIIPIDGVLNSIQGASGFAQLLQQTGVLDQLRQSGTPYTLFIPTNSALQSIGVTNNVHQLRQFVLRHICPDVLLDPVNNVLRRSAGFYTHDQRSRSRQKRQSWTQLRRNETHYFPGAANLGSGSFQSQQPVSGGYLAAPMVMNPWNQTAYRPFVNRQGGWATFPGANPNSGAQSCRSLTGERITVQSLAGTQPGGNSPSLSFQNFMVTCCADQSVNALVQSYNVYPPNFAVYLLGRTLLSQGQTIGNLNNRSSLVLPSISLVLLSLALLLNLSA